MKTEQLLIFDLDDTIFETKSIALNHVESILSDFKTTAQPYFTADEIDLITAELWKYPFDHVSKKFKLNDSIKRQFSNSVNSLDYQLEIEAFSDFEHVRTINVNKVLVTTGFKKLQLAKITALNLVGEFKEIYIDEIDSADRIHKKGIFEHLINVNDIILQDYFVIGDNPESELKAGYELGFTTIQIAKFNQPKSRYSDYHITNFQDLIEILKMKEQSSQ